MDEYTPYALAFLAFATAGTLVLSIGAQLRQPRHAWLLFGCRALHLVATASAFGFGVVGILAKAWIGAVVFLVIGLIGTATVGKWQVA